MTRYEQKVRLGLELLFNSGSPLARSPVGK
jgi:hypothetical protein